MSSQVTDSSGAPSNTTIRDISSRPTNDAPVLTTTVGDDRLTENAAAVVVDGGVTVADADDANIESGQVRISAGFQPR